MPLQLVIDFFRLENLEEKSIESMEMQTGSEMNCNDKSKWKWNGWWAAVEVLSPLWPPRWSRKNTLWSLFFLTVEPLLPHSGVSSFSQWCLFLFLRVEFRPLQPHHHLQLILLLSVNDLKVHYANCNSRFISTCPAPNTPSGDWLNRCLFGLGEPTVSSFFILCSRPPCHLKRPTFDCGLRDADKLRQKKKPCKIA